MGVGIVIENWVFIGDCFVVVIIEGFSSNLLMILVDIFIVIFIEVIIVGSFDY